jgi:hypothetical protein
MKFRRAAAIALTVLIAACSEKPRPDREKDAAEPAREAAREPEGESREAERGPEEDKIAEDCATFVRSTKVLPAQAASTDCPACPAGGTALLTFRQLKIDAVNCSGDTCTVRVTIRAIFNPASGQTIAGGLTAWIPPEERSEYLSGHVPEGEQLYRVHITYKRTGGLWRAIEFDRAPAE